jgi:hypothetical protein
MWGDGEFWHNLEKKSKVKGQRGKGKGQRAKGKSQRAKGKGKGQKEKGKGLKEKGKGKCEGWVYSEKCFIAVKYFAGALAWDWSNN